MFGLILAFIALVVSIPLILCGAAVAVLAFE